MPDGRLMDPELNRCGVRGPSWNRVRPRCLHFRCFTSSCDRHDLVSHHHDAVKSFLEGCVKLSRRISSRSLASKDPCKRPLHVDNPTRVLFHRPHFHFRRRWTTSEMKVRELTIYDLLSRRRSTPLPRAQIPPVEHVKSLAKCSEAPNL